MEVDVDTETKGEAEDGEGEGGGDAAVGGKLDDPTATALPLGQSASATSAATFESAPTKPIDEVTKLLLTPVEPRYAERTALMPSAAVVAGIMAEDFII